MERGLKSAGSTGPCILLGSLQEAGVESQLFLEKTCALAVHTGGLRGKGRPKAWT